MRYINIIIAAVVVGAAVFFIFSDREAQSADLGQVLDRSVFAIERYEAYLKENGVGQAGEKELEKLTSFMGDVMNAKPQFYAEPLGVTLQHDATFLAYADTNANGVQDEGEGKVFTVEVDEANRRLIATDATGNASHSGFSGTSLLAGVLIGSLISRQRAAGVTAASFNNRNSVSRTNYRAPASARTRSRSGGLAGGK